MNEAILTEPQVADDEWAQAMEEQNAGTMESSDTTHQLSGESETNTSTVTDAGQSRSASNEELTRSSAVLSNFPVTVFSTTLATISI